MQYADANVDRLAKSRKPGGQLWQGLVGFTSMATGVATAPMLGRESIAICRDV